MSCNCAGMNSTRWPVLCLFCSGDSGRLMSPWAVLIVLQQVQMVCQRAQGFCQLVDHAGSGGLSEQVKCICFMLEFLVTQVSFHFNVGHGLLLSRGPRGFQKPEIWMHVHNASTHSMVSESQWFFCTSVRYHAHSGKNIQDLRFFVSGLQVCFWKCAAE